MLDLPEMYQLQLLIYVDGHHQVVSDIFNVCRLSMHVLKHLVSLKQTNYQYIT